MYSNSIESIPSVPLLLLMLLIVSLSAYRMQCSANLFYYHAKQEVGYIHGAIWNLPVADY